MISPHDEEILAAFYASAEKHARVLRQLADDVEAEVGAEHWGLTLKGKEVLLCLSAICSAQGIEIQMLSERLDDLEEKR